MSEGAGQPRRDALPPRLRRATAEDALCIGVLGTQVFLDTYATGGVRRALAREVLAAFATDACRSFIEAKDSIVQVAEIDGHLVGFGHLVLGARHELAPSGAQSELVRLYVQERFTGKGIGSALLREAERAAASAGSTVLWLTPWAYNDRALRFYARHGYVDCGQTWFRFEGESHENRLMALRLLPQGG